VRGLLFFEIDGLVFVAANGFANLRRRLAEFGLLVGKDAFFCACGALGAVHPFEATAQAGVAQGAVATAIAGELVGHAADFGHILVDMLLPVVGEFVAGKQGRQGADLEGRRGVVGRNVVSGIGPLGVTSGGEREDAQSEEPAMLEEFFHKRSLRPILSAF
jgi:hypothetical protein